MSQKALKLSALNLQYPKRNGPNCCKFAYSPPNFFEQISSGNLSLIVNQYENIIITGHLNISLLDPINDTRNYFSDLRDTYFH